MSTKCRVNRPGQEELRFAWRCPEPGLPAFPWEPLTACGEEGGVAVMRGVWSGSLGPAEGPRRGKEAMWGEEVRRHF